MSLTLADIDNVRKKVHDPIPVGELPDVIRRALHLRVPIVQLSNHTLKHINVRHPDVTDFDLLFLPLVIQHGLILQERAKPKMILACYGIREDHRHFIAAMKFINRGCEVWLDSFYRIRPKQVEKLKIKCKTLKFADRK